MNIDILPLFYILTNTSIFIDNSNFEKTEIICYCYFFLNFKLI